MKSAKLAIADEDQRRPAEDADPGIAAADAGQGRPDLGEFILEKLSRNPAAG